MQTNCILRSSESQLSNGISINRIGRQVNQLFELVHEETDCWSWQRRCRCSGPRRLSQRLKWKKSLFMQTSNVAKHHEHDVEEVVPCWWSWRRQCVVANGLSCSSVVRQHFLLCLWICLCWSATEIFESGSCTTFSTDQSRDRAEEVLRQLQVFVIRKQSHRCWLQISVVLGPVTWCTLGVSFSFFCQKFGSDCVSVLLLMIYRVKMGGCI